MAAGEQRGGHRAGDLRLPDHAPGDLRQQPIEIGAEGGDRGRRVAGDVVGRCGAGRGHGRRLPDRGRMRSKYRRTM